ncbi:PIG-L deacetylase family protein [Acidilobus sp.]|uniref:PIG-L deacetylase family protein n=1 Tax=Acidilobus sp. TaxID=1872109 RepID=UPI003D009F85
MKAARVLFVAPHPDDECINAGGLLSMLLSLGHEVHAVYMTDGRLGSPRPEERGDALAARRRQEALKALDVLGVPRSNAVFLNFRDGELINHVGEAARTLSDVLTSLRPDLVIALPQLRAAPGPQGLGAGNRRGLKGLRGQG